MRLRKNRVAERAGVNAARAFFEAAGHVFQEVDTGNDYGKDAYVDLGTELAVTGLCIAIQIKSGASYRRSDGYGIPIAEHEQIWRESTVPIAGIVHDPADGKLYWCDISSFLAAHPTDLPSEIPVRKEDTLTPDTLIQAFTSHFKVTARQHAFGGSILQLLASSEERQVAALYDCFALGRSDPRALIMVRYLLRILDGGPLELAIHLLSHATPHPDIMWDSSNWVTDQVQAQIAQHFRWNTEEISDLLSAVSWEDWQRGAIGESLYMLLAADPERKPKMRAVLEDALCTGDETVAWASLYLVLYWSREDAERTYEAIVAEFPHVRRLPLIAELEHLLSEYHSVSLF